MVHRKLDKPPPSKEYVAIQDYAACYDGELSFYKGDIIDSKCLAAIYYTCEMEGVFFTCFSSSSE